MRLNLTKISVLDYLRAKTKSTTEIYLIYLNKYFQNFYPELVQEWKPVRRRKDQQQPYWDKLDKISLESLESDRSLRQDLLTYKESIQKYTPKTRGVQLSSVIGFFEDNGIKIPKTTKRSLWTK
jgi:hypothetical protein